MSLNKYDSSTGELINIASGSRIWVGTQAAYDAQKQAGTLPNNTLIVITDDEQQTEAEQISYDNTDSGLAADNVQDAIDSLTNNNNIKLNLLSDCNSVSSLPGGWYFNYATGSTANTPATNLWGAVISVKIAGSAIIQLFMPHSATTLYTRIYATGGWTSWHRYDAAT